MTELLAPLLLEGRLGRMRDVLSRRTRHLCALVEQIHDPHNVAACMRSADACGVQDLHIVSGDGGELGFSRVVTQGCHRWLTLRYHASTEDAVRHLREAGYRIAATDLQPEPAPVPLGEVDVATPLCLAFGNESEGISPTLRRLADFRVSIPMLGFSESLNISVAFALAFQHLRRAWGVREDDPIDLDPTARARLLDRWVLEDVRGGEAVVVELARRALSGVDTV